MSGIMLIVFRSLRQHALSTVITVVSTALACGLVMGVFSVKTQTHDAFTGGQVGFDAVLGARGSQLQLVAQRRLSSGDVAGKYFVDDVSGSQQDADRLLRDSVRGRNTSMASASLARRRTSSPSSNTRKERSFSSTTDDSSNRNCRKP